MPDTAEKDVQVVSVGTIAQGVFWGLVAFSVVSALLWFGVIAIFGMAFGM